MNETKKYWKSLSQLNNDPIVKKLSENEFVEELPVDEFLGDQEALSNSTTSRRDFLKFLGFTTAAATIAAMGIKQILGSVIWAFDFAMSGLFFPLVLGVWWKRANAQGAIAGMLLGLFSGTAYLIWVETGGAGFLDITQATFGIVGASVSLVSMVVVSLMIKAPDAATQKMVDEVRIPSGKTVLGKQH